MLYADIVKKVNQSTGYDVSICTTKKTIFRGSPRKILHMLDDEKIQKLLGKRKYYIKYRGTAQTLSSLYQRAKEKGIKKWGDIPVSMLR